MNKRTIAGVTLMVTAALLTACSQSSSSSPPGQSAQPPAAKVKDEPVTLTAMFDSVADAELGPIVIEALKAKYPSITLNFVTGKLTDLIAAGSTPDILFTFPGNMVAHNDLGLMADLSPLIKAHNVDLGRFEKTLVDGVRSVSLTNQQVAIPYTKQFTALYYNKDIFDKFGVAYPKPGMTYDDTVNLARNVSRLDGSTQYVGFSVGSLYWFAMKYSMRIVDYKTDKFNIANNIFRRNLELGYAIYNLPGIDKPKNKTVFIKDRTQAMLEEANIIPELVAAAKDGLNWDVTQAPSTADNRNITTPGFNVVYPSKTSKHQDRAMQVIEVITSDEVQTAYAKLGRTSPLINPAVQTAFETSSDLLRSKNLKEIFLSKQPPYPISTVYESKATPILNKHATDYYKGLIDLNTAMSRAEEEINKMVAEEKVKMGK